MLTYAEINELIQQGATRFYANDSVGTCDIWLTAWEHIKAIMDANNLKDINEADGLYSWDEPLANWVQDLADELHNAGISDTGYHQKRIDFCKELCERCPSGDHYLLIKNNSRCAIAESYFKLKEYEMAEKEFETLINDEPNWDWGYIHWADCYVWELESPLYDKAAEILEKGLSNPKIDNTEDMRIRASEYFTNMDYDEQLKPIGAKLQRLAGKVKQMELKEALQNIQKWSKTFAHDEIICIREHRDEAIPHLLELIVKATADHKAAEQWNENLDNHSYAMHLLAEFGVHEALPLFIEILELDYDTCESILGDTLTEGMGSIVASVAEPSDIERIKSIAENTELKSYQRGAAVNALIVLYTRGIYKRGDLVEFMGKLLANGDDDYDFLTSTVMYGYEISAKELYPRILELFAEDRLETFFISAKQFQEDSPKVAESEILKQLKKRSYFNPITDTVKSMDWWACFEDYKPEEKQNEKSDNTTGEFIKDIEKEMAKRKAMNELARRTEYSDTPIVKGPKIGRNAPCPCGSGKKYKKCCLS